MTAPAPSVPQRRVLAERIDAVDRDAAARHVEMGRLAAQRRRAVRGVGDAAGVRALDVLRERAKPLELGVEEVGLGLVRGGEVRHHAGQLEASSKHPPAPRAARAASGSERPQAPHPGVELHVHPRGPVRRGARLDGAHELLPPRHHVGANVQHKVELGKGQRTHHEQRSAQRRPRAARRPRGRWRRPARSRRRHSAARAQEVAPWPYPSAFTTAHRLRGPQACRFRRRAVPRSTAPEVHDRRRAPQRGARGLREARGQLGHADEPSSVRPPPGPATAARPAGRRSRRRRSTESGKPMRRAATRGRPPAWTAHGGAGGR